VLKLARHASEELTSFAQDRELKIVADAFAHFIRAEPASPDGLSDSARVVIALAETHLVDAIYAELALGPLAVDRTILLLNGTPGAAIVSRAILQPLLTGLGISTTGLAE